MTVQPFATREAFAATPSGGPVVSCPFVLPARSNVPVAVSVASKSARHWFTAATDRLALFSEKVLSVLAIVDAVQPVSFVPVEDAVVMAVFNVKLQNDPTNNAQFLNVFVRFKTAAPA